MLNTDKKKVEPVKSKRSINEVHGRCPRCKGSGENNQGGECEECDGTGFVPESSKEFKEGDKVTLTSGNFKGTTGKITKVENGKYVINGIISNVPAENLKLAEALDLKDMENRLKGYQKKYN